MTDCGCEMSTPSWRHEESFTRIGQLRANHQLPSPKGVALAIMEISRQEDAKLDDVARIVASDPALTARILRLANAAAQGNGRPVASVSEAVLRLGFANVRQVAMGFSLMDQYMNGPCDGFDYARFWSHSLLMALAIRALSMHARIAGADELFASGLMARIGRLALATIHPVEYAGLLHEGVDDARLASLERERLRADHNDFTVAILCDIGMPKVFVEPIYYHESPEASGFTEGSRPYQLVHLLYHAKRLADMGLAPEGLRPPIISELMLLGGRLGLSADDMGALVDRVIAEWREWSQLLRVPAQGLPSFAQMSTAPAPRSDDQGALYPPMRVLLVEDEPTERLKMEAVLSGIVGCKVHTARDGHEALAMALDIMPRIVVTDWLMPVMDGIEFCRALRATDWGKTMYVIMLTGVDDENEIVQAFEAGVDDYVGKPVNLRSIRARMRAALHYVQLLEAWERDRAQLKQFTAELAISNRKLEHFALTDLLTGLPNRRAAMDVLSQAWSAANRAKHSLSVMAVDIDHFKAINDTYGHAVGDKALSEVARLIRANARKDDHVSRIGGEEFLLICQNSDLGATLQAAERLRRMVGETPIVTEQATFHVRLSIGVATKEDGMANAEVMVAAADNALYGAKNAGRNRACVMTRGQLLCGQNRIEAIDADNAAGQ